MKKRIICLLMAVLLIMALSVTAFADGGYMGDYVRDYNNLLTQEQAESLEAMAKKASEKVGCGIYLVTVDNYREDTGNSMDFEAAQVIYESNGLGTGENKEGIMLMMSMEDRHMYLLAHGKAAQAAMNKDHTDNVKDHLHDYFSEDDWYNGFCKYVDMAESYAGMAAGSPFNSHKVAVILLGVVLCLLIGAVIALIVTLILKQQLKSVAVKAEASNYVDGGLNLNFRNDVFSHTTVSRVYSPPNDNNNDSDSGIDFDCDGDYSGSGDDF